MASESDKYTREHLADIVRRLRQNPAELERVIGSLEARHRRTLRRDLAPGGWEGRASGRSIDALYMRAVCSVFLNRFTSNVYNSVIDIVVGDVDSQSRLDAMLGKYTGYWPAQTANSFTKWPMEITKTDGMYTVTSTTGDKQFKYDHHGFAFLVRNRVHVIEVRPNGIRYMLFHYEQFPARNAVSGIIVNVLRTESTGESEKLFAVHFLAFHEKHPRHGGEMSDQELASSLTHPRNRIGVIRV
jgi:hypothetical protein